MAQVKKLSIKTVVGGVDPREVLKADKPISLMKVWGTAVGTKTGEAQYGQWTALVGSFEASNSETGEVSAASQLFLPDVALLPIQVALSAPDARGVNFAIELFVRPAVDGKPGGSVFEYTFEPLMPAAANDPMAALRAIAMGTTAPALGDGSGGEPETPTKKKK